MKGIREEIIQRKADGTVVALRVTQGNKQWELKHCNEKTQLIVKMLHNEAMSQKQIAMETGVSYNYVNYLNKRYGVRTPQRHQSLIEFA